MTLVTCLEMAGLVFALEADEAGWSEAKPGPKWEVLKEERRELAGVLKALESDAVDEDFLDERRLKTLNKSKWLELRVEEVGCATSSLS